MLDVKLACFSRPVEDIFDQISCPCCSFASDSYVDPDEGSGRAKLLRRFSAVDFGAERCRVSPATLVLFATWTSAAGAADIFDAQSPRVKEVKYEKQPIHDAGADREREEGSTGDKEAP